MERRQLESRGAREQNTTASRCRLGIQRWAEDQPLPDRLRWTAAYFRFCGISSAVVLGVSLLSLLVSPDIRAEVAAHSSSYLLMLLLSGITAAAWWWTGERLYARQRDGAWMGVANLAIPLLRLGHANAGASVSTLVISALGLIAILTSWRELD